MDAPRAILFDFDGTIADTVEVGVAAFNELARRYSFSEITPQNANMLREKGPRAAMKELSIPLLKVPLVVRTLRKGVRSIIPTLQVTDGMKDVVANLKERGYRLGIVTSNSEDNVRAFLENNGMDQFFDFIRAGVGVFSKSLAIKRTIVREGLERTGTVFIGDEIRDIEAAKKNKLKVIGVTWGINSREGLAVAQPDYIVDTAVELVALL